MDRIEETIAEVNLGKHDNFSQAEIKSLKYINGSWEFAMEVALK